MFPSIEEMLDDSLYPEMNTCSTVNIDGLGKYFFPMSSATLKEKVVE